MTSDRLPPLNSLRCFEAAARLESFARAGDELYLTHGAISRQIRLLEGALGTPLFERRNRRVYLTEAGSTLLVATQGAFGRLTEACHELRHRSLEPLVLSCEPTLTQRWLIPRLSQLRQKHPEVVIRIHAGGGPINFDSGRVDLAIRRNDFEFKSTIFAELILDEDVGPVCGPSLARTGDEAILRHTRIHTATRPRAWDDWFASTKREPTAAASLPFDHFYLSIQAAVAGLGVAIGPRPLVLDDLASGTLVAPFGFTPSGFGYYLLSPRPFEPSSRAYALLVWLREVTK